MKAHYGKVELGEYRWITGDKNMYASADYRAGGWMKCLWCGKEFKGGYFTFRPFNDEVKTFDSEGCRFAWLERWEPSFTETLKQMDASAKSKGIQVIGGIDGLLTGDAG